MGIILWPLVSSFDVVVIVVVGVVIVGVSCVLSDIRMSVRYIVNNVLA